MDASNEQQPIKRLLSFRGKVFNFRDITERKRAEQENLLLATAVANIGDGICVTDPEGCIVFVNAALEHMLGYEWSELIGMPVSRLYPGGADSPVLQEIMQALLASGWSGDVELRTKSGELVPTLESATPMRDETGSVVGYVCVNTDISDRKHAEEELAKHSRELARSNVDLLATPGRNYPILVPRPV